MVRLKKQHTIDDCHHAECETKRGTCPRYWLANYNTPGEIDLGERIESSFDGNPILFYYKDGIVIVPNLEITEEPRRKICALTIDAILPKHKKEETEEILDKLMKIVEEPSKRYYETKKD